MAPRAELGRLLCWEASAARPRAAPAGRELVGRSRTPRTPGLGQVAGWSAILRTVRTLGCQLSGKTQQQQTTNVVVVVVHIHTYIHTYVCM